MCSSSLCFTRAWQVPGLAHVLQRQLQGHVAAQPLYRCTGALPPSPPLHWSMMIQPWCGIVLPCPCAGSNSMPLCCWPAQEQAVLLQERLQGRGTHPWEGPCGPDCTPQRMLCVTAVGCHCCHCPAFLSASHAGALTKSTVTPFTPWFLQLAAMCPAD